MKRTSHLFFWLLVLACCVCAVTAHRKKQQSCSPIGGCANGGACSCTCSKRGHRGLLDTPEPDAAANSSSSGAAAAARRRHHHGNDDDDDNGGGSIGDACVPSNLFGSMRSASRWGGGRQDSCKRGSCVCACTTANDAPVALDDDITLVDPTGPSGPGVVTLDVLSNDADPNGDAFEVVAYWIVPNSAGDSAVVPVGLAPGGQGVVVRVPDGTNGFAVEYVAQDARGALSAPRRAQVAVVLQGSPSLSYPIGTKSKPACQGYSSSCKSVFTSSTFKADNECKQAGGTCEAGTPSDTCNSDKWDLSAKPTYCLNDFKNNCGAPGTSGCTRCSIYQLALKCAKGGSGTTDCKRFPNSSPTHVIIRTSERGSGCDCDGGKGLCLCNEHWLMMPTNLCRGVEDGGQRCTGDDSIPFWKDAYEYGTDKLGKNDNWALQINAPNQRGQQHMHIHIAKIKTFTGPVGVMRAAATVTGTVASPQRFPATGGPYLLAAFFDKKTAADIVTGGAIRPFELGYKMHYNYFTNADTAALTPFGIGILPWHNGGIVLFTAYDFADTNYLSLDFDKSKCFSRCSAFS